VWVVVGAEYVVGGVVGGCVVDGGRVVTGGLVVGVVVGPARLSWLPSVPRGRMKVWPVLGSTSTKMLMITVFFTTTVRLFSLKLLHFGPLYVGG
jgi:hypothetical protein